MLRFISFGSGSCGNCYYLYTEDYGVLIDIGIGVRKLKKYFQDYGLSMATIKAVLITHDHADHVKSVGAVVNALSVPAYATAEVHAGIQRNYVVHKKIDAANIRKVIKNEPFKLGPLTVTAFTVPHDSMDNVGYKVQCGNVTFCLMTDAGHVTDEMKHLINESQYLVIEANHDEQMLQTGPYPGHLKARVASRRGHLSNTECAQNLAAYGTEALKHVWLCHLSQENNHPELARKTVEQALMTSENFDGTRVKLDVLKRNQPSNIFTLD